MVRTPEQAVQWASTPRSGYGGLCLKFVRQAYNIGAKYSSARAAWHGATCKHATTSLSGVPYGAPLFMDKSSSKYGHVALYIGNGRMLTTDSSKKFTQNASVQSWLNVGYRILGWSEDLNGVRVIPRSTISGGGGGSSGTIATDGIWGPGTIRKFQAALGRNVDGVISSQNVRYRASNPGLAGGWEWVSNPKGSLAIAAHQRLLNSRGRNVGDADGLIGPLYIKGLQADMGTTVDGVLSRPSQAITALQKRLNAGSI
jgi:hypothetical protein